MCSGGGSIISEESAFSLLLVRQAIVHATTCGHVFAVVTQKDHCERCRVEEVTFCSRSDADRISRALCHTRWRCERCIQMPSLAVALRCSLCHFAVPMLI